MKARSKILLVLLSALLLLVMLTTGLVGTTGTSVRADYIDDNNVTGGDDFTFPGTWDGTPSDAAWTFKNQSLWKISLYVAKDYRTHYDDASATLSDDFYKFGSTFWLYRDGYGPETTAEGGMGSKLSKTLVEYYNKEEYLRGNMSFREVTYDSVKSRFFKATDYSLPTSGRRAVPLIPNYGGSVSEVSDFFDKNIDALRAFMQMAAKAGNISNIDSWLRGKTFTINGETKSGWDLKMIDPRNGTREQHTSQVAWVVLYEPVFLIDNMQKSGYVHAITPSGIAKSTLEGKYVFRSSHNTSSEFNKLFDGAPIPSSIQSGNYRMWGLGLDHASTAMPGSIYLQNNWFGFFNGSMHKTITVNGVPGRYWSLPQQLEGGGMGLRYTRADEFYPTVVIQKTVDGSKTGSLAGFRFTITNDSTRETWTQVTPASGKITLYLPPGTYTITEDAKDGYEAFKPQKFTVPSSATSGQVINVTVNNEKIKTGKMTITKFADDKDYSGTSFTITGPNGIRFTIPASGTDGSYTYDSGKDPIRYTYKTDKVGGNSVMVITLDKCPLGSYTVTETRPSRYDLTHVRVNYKNLTTALSGTAEITQSVSPDIRFDNYAEALATATMWIYKYSEDGMYDDVTFHITGPSGIDFSFLSTKSGSYTYDTGKDPISYSCMSFTAVPPSFENPFKTPISKYQVIYVSKLPPGEYTIEEIRPDRYGKTLVQIDGGEQIDTTTVQMSFTGRSDSMMNFVNFLAEYGSLEITKESTDGKVSGVEFTITGPDGYSETRTTDSSGKILLTKLKPGEYTVSENGDEKTYYVPPDQTVTVTADETARVTFQNVNKRTVTVRYFDKYTKREIGTRYTYTDEQGASYNVTPQTQVSQDGYDFIDRVEGDAIKGTLDKDKVIDVYYGYHHTVTVNYYDKYTKSSIADSFTYTEEHNTAYDVTAQTTVMQDGYDFIDRTEGDAAKGTLDKDKEINVYYGYNHTITVNYYDKYTNDEITGSYTVTREHNTAYDVTAQTTKSQSGYDFIDRTEGDDAKGTLDEDKEINVYYGYNHKITVRYFDKYTNREIENVSRYETEAEHGTHYDVTAKTQIMQPGYTSIDRVEGDDVSGTLDKDKVIDVYYGYGFNVTVNYYDKYDNHSIAKSYTYAGENNTPYDVTEETELSIAGYDFIDRVEGDAVSGTLDKSKVINVYYGYNNKITVRYFDKYTNREIAARYETSAEHNTLYNVTDKTQILQPGYTSIDRVEGDEASGTLDEDKVIDVYYGYGFTVTVNYYDKYTGGSIAKSYVLEGENMTPYDVTKEAGISIVGYDFIDRVEGDPVKGTLDKSKVINVYYGYRHTITVNYYDKYTNDEITGSYTVTREHNTAYVYGRQRGHRNPAARAGGKRLSGKGETAERERTAWRRSLYRV